MARPKLHLDADTSIKPLRTLLTGMGNDVTRTPNEWMPHDTSYGAQRLRATAQGRVIFTFNMRDVGALAGRHPCHGGIVLAAQGRWRLGDLAPALDRLLDETDAADWPGRVEWLNR